MTEHLTIVNYMESKLKAISWRQFMQIPLKICLFLMVAVVEQSIVTIYFMPLNDKVDKYWVA